MDEEGGSEEFLVFWNVLKALAEEVGLTPVAEYNDDLLDSSFLKARVFFVHPAHSLHHCVHVLQANASYVDLNRNCTVHDICAPTCTCSYVLPGC